MFSFFRKKRKDSKWESKLIDMYVEKPSFPRTYEGYYKFSDDNKRIEVNPIYKKLELQVETPVEQPLARIPTRSVHTFGQTNTFKMVQRSKSMYIAREPFYIEQVPHYHPMLSTVNGRYLVKNVVFTPVNLPKPQKAEIIN